MRGQGRREGVPRSGVLLLNAHLPSKHKDVKIVLHEKSLFCSLLIAFSFFFAPRVQYNECQLKHWMLHLCLSDTDGWMGVHMCLQIHVNVHLTHPTVHLQHAWPCSDMQSGECEDRGVIPAGRGWREERGAVAS